MINPATGIEDPNYVDPNAATQITPPTSGLINAPSATATTPAISAPTSTTPSAPVYGAPSTQGWNVTDNQTVEGRIKGLIDANSPLMQQAATTGLQQSNARGLANSSMSVGASQAEVLKAATPIATADANIQANAAQFNAIDPNKQMQITSSEKLAGMNIDADMNRLTTELASRKDLSDADIAARKDQLVTEIMSREKLAEADRVAVAARLDTELASRERISTLENDTRIKLAGDETAYKILIEQNQGAAGLYDTYQKAVNAIMTSSMDTANKQKALDNQYMALKAGMTMYQDVDGLNLDGILNPVSSGATGETGTTGTTGTTGGLGSAPGSGALMVSQQDWDNAMASLVKPTAEEYSSDNHPFDRAGYDAAIKKYKADIAALGPRPA